LNHRTQGAGDPSKGMSTEKEQLRETERNGVKDKTLIGIRIHHTLNTQLVGD